jgi:hypothetical protein
MDLFGEARRVSESETKRRGGNGLMECLYGVFGRNVMKCDNNFWEKGREGMNAFE